MQLYVFEVIDKVAKARSKAQKIELLKEHETGALRDVLRGIFDETIIWLLPQGAPPPYTPNKEESVPSNLIKECVQLAYFVKGGAGPNLNKIRREKMFIGLLEAIHPKDAELLIDVINKKAPKGISRNVVEEAFPDLLRDKK